jgi:hypothetical protein
MFIVIDYDTKIFYFCPAKRLIPSTVSRRKPQTAHKFRVATNARRIRGDGSVTRASARKRQKSQRPSCRPVIMTAPRCKGLECNENSRKFETFMAQCTT